MLSFKINIKFIFNQDPDDDVVARANTYVHSLDDHRAMHFAYLCIFGHKEPIYSSYHLSLCDPKTLLMLRNESTLKFILLQQVLNGGDGVTFEVSFQVMILSTLPQLPNKTFHMIKSLISFGFAMMIL